MYAVTEAFLAGVPDPPLHHRGSLDVDLALDWPELTASDAEGTLLAALTHGAGATSIEQYVNGVRVTKARLMAALDRPGS